MTSKSLGPMENDKRSTFLALLVLVALPLFAGALLAPYIFNILVFAGRNCDGMDDLRNLEFASVATRTMLIGMLVAFWPAMAVIGNVRQRLRGLFGGEHRGQDLLGGFFIGVGTMLVLPVAGLLASAYSPAGQWEDVLLKGAAFLIAGLAVAFLEELLFRGVLFNLLWRLIGFGKGVFAAALVFSLVHFINPIKPAGVVYGHWYSGFVLLWKAVTAFDISRTEIFPYCLSLFFIGASLCIIYSMRRNLYMIAGIHAGWIWVLKLTGSVLERSSSRNWVFGGNMVVEKNYGTLILAALFFVVVVCWRARITASRHGADGPG